MKLIRDFHFNLDREIEDVGLYLSPWYRANFIPGPHVRCGAQPPNMGGIYDIALLL